MYTQVYTSIVPSFLKYAKEMNVKKTPAAKQPVYLVDLF